MRTFPTIPTPTPVRSVPGRNVDAILGICRRTRDRRMAEGTLPRGFPVGGAVRWFEHEAQAIALAVAAGATDDELRDLTRRIVEARQAAAEVAA